VSGLPPQLRKDGRAALEQEIAAETDSSLARVAERVEAALAELDRRQPLPGVDDALRQLQSCGRIARNFAVMLLSAACRSAGFAHSSSAYALQKPAGNVPCRC
jgi:hypothetical protein